MNTLVRKEIRSILPVWLLAMVLAILPVWIVWPGPNGVFFGDLGLLVFAPFGLGVLLLALTPFGQELNWGTFPVLLAQPVSRDRLWLVKVTTAAVALGLAFVAFYVSNHVRVESALESMKHTVWRNAFETPNEQTAYFLKIIADTRRAAARDTLLIGGLEALAGFAGGLWTTLLFRQVTAAFWLTWLVPMGLTILGASLLKNLPDAVSRACLAVMLGAYSAAGYLWAKRFFLRVQDTHWTGGVIALPAWGELAAGKTSISVRRKWKPIRTLVRKEFQAQQVNVLLACGLLLVHLGVIALWRWSTEYMATHASVAMTLEMVPLLWLAMPLLIGSVAVAEERKLGMFQTTLCLPSSRRVQFLIKLFVALLLGLVLGGVLPLLVETLAPLARLGGGFNGMDFLGGIRSIIFLQLAGSVSLTFLAFYGSTLTRNALQGMGAGLLGAIIACLLVVAAQRAGDSAQFLLWRGPLIGLIGWPAMMLVLLLLAYRNYGKLLPDTRTWASNGVTLLATLFCVTAITTTIYHRAWEAWLPQEPPHQFFTVYNLVGDRGMRPVPARANGVTHSFAGLNLQDLTPTLARELKLKQTTGALVANVAPKGPADQAGLKAGDIIVRFNGSNVSDSRQLARAVAATSSDSRVPIQVLRDGSTLNMEITVGRMSERARGSRPGTKIVATGSQRAVVLPDGRLWLQQRPVRLITQRTKKQEYMVWYASGPQHTGFIAGSDWKDVAVIQGACCALRTDGTLWDLSQTGQSQVSPRMLGQDQNWITISGGGDHFSALKSDGTLWEWGWEHTQSGPRLTTPRQVGTDADWVDVCDYWSKSAAIKQDGAVWRWDWRSRRPGMPHPWLDGACTEPVSLSLSSHALAAVCGDGTLWIGGDLTNSGYARLVAPGLAQRASREMVRWGNDSDWREIRFVSWDKAAGVKRDGTLWEWDVNFGFGPLRGWVVTPIMSSRYEDWLAVGEDENAYLALALDGSLCLWGDPEDRGYRSWNGLPDSSLLLMPSRIKATRIAELAR